MRFKSLSCCLCLLSALAAAPGSALADEWNKHWSTGAKPEVRVHAGDAAVVIQAADGNSGIDAHVTTRGWSTAVVVSR